jgi:hypothetical protein
VIAAAVGRSVPNLRKFFAVELGLENKSAAAPVKITAQMRDDVALMAACGEPQARIAKAIGVGEADLAKHFAADLEAGAARYRLKVLRRLEDQADKNLGALTKLAALTAPGSDGADTSSGYIGKKVAAKADAEAAIGAGSKFAPRSAPRLAAVNGEAITKDG